MPYKQIKKGAFVFASALEITAFPKAELLSKDPDRAFSILRNTGSDLTQLLASPVPLCGLV